MAPKAQHAQAIPSDMLKKLTAKARELRDTELEIETLNERLKEASARQYAIEHEELPELMMEAGTDHIGIPADGNMPAMDLKLKPFYSANIAAAWEPERRDAAFNYLTDEGAGDLIKTEITLKVPRELRDKVPQLLSKLEKASPSGVSIETKEAVHSATLKSWLKEKSEAGEEVKLDLIGGSVGTVVTTKPRKS